jgi:hypothetical protein
VVVAAQLEPKLQAAGLALHVADARAGLEPAPQIAEHIHLDATTEPASRDLANARRSRSGHADAPPRRLGRSRAGFAA